MVGQIVIVCPKTGKEIQTGTVVQKKDFDSDQPMSGLTHCPLCRQLHRWSRDLARFRP